MKNIKFYLLPIDDGGETVVVMVAITKSKQKLDDEDPNRKRNLFICSTI